MWHVMTPHRMETSGWDEQSWLRVLEHDQKQQREAAFKLLAPEVRLRGGERRKVAANEEVMAGRAGQRQQFGGLLTETAYLPEPGREEASIFFQKKDVPLLNNVDIYLSAS